MLRILYITPYVPNQIRVRAFQLLQALARRGHAITLGAVRTEASDLADLDTLRGLGIRIVDAELPRTRSLLNCLLALPTAQPLQAAYCWHAGLSHRLTQLALAEPFDVLHVEHLRGAPYGLALRRALRAVPVSTPLVWDSVDCITHLFRQAAQRSATRFGRLVTRLELGRTRRYEPYLAAQFDRTLVTSPLDRQALLELAAAADMPGLGERVNVVPNGVDLDYFTPDATPREPETLIFTGKMSYHANVTAAQQLLGEIMPLVWRQRPSVQVWIVGKDPPHTLVRLAQEAGAGRVWVSGVVPDLRPYLRRATVAVAPIPYGAGIQNKVLEAMACGTPVIASPQAVSALKVKAGQEVLVAADRAGFAAQILTCLDAPEQRATLARTGRAYVEDHHDWSHIGAALETIYADLARSRQPAAVPVWAH